MDWDALFQGRLAGPQSVREHVLDHFVKENALRIKQDLCKLLHYNWEMYLFGSVVTGLASSTSDVDIYICPDENSYFQNITREKKIEHLENILYMLLTNHGINGEIFQLCDYVYDARVPILRVLHVPSQTMVDVSSTNGLGVENSKLIRMYLDSDERIKWLVLYVHKWAKEVDILGKGPKFRPYALTWLVLFFLMQTSPPMVCPVVDLWDESKKRIVAGWNCGFVNSLPKTKNSQEITMLLVDFMKFITSTDFKNNVICPLTGSLVPKTKFKTIDLLSPLFKSYQDRLKEGKKYKLKTDTAICIQDPLELCHNVAKQVNMCIMKTFVEICKESSKNNNITIVNNVEN